MAIAEELGDIDYQLRALRALWVARNNGGEPAAALEFAARFCRLEAEHEVPEQRIGRRLRGRSLHLLGRLDEAHADLTAMLDEYVEPTLRSHVARFQFDQRVSARITLGLILWVQGHSRRALRDMEDVIAGALARGHMLTLINALADGACPIALLAGDLAAAERFTTLLEENTRTRALDVWRSFAACFRGELLIRRGEAAAGVDLLRRAVEEQQRSGFILFRTLFLGALAQGLGSLDRADEGLVVAADALDQCERTGEAWCTPELLRIRGELLLRQDDAPAAEDCYCQSLLAAKRQGALSWSLRTATSLARLLRAQGRTAEAAAILGPIHARMAIEEASEDVSVRTATGD